MSFATNDQWLSGDSAVTVGRRSAPRLRLSVPARLVTLCDTRRCILVDLSRSGAQIGLEKPLREGESVFLQLAGIDQFGTIVRSFTGSGGGANGLEFEYPQNDEQVLAMRQYAECFEGEAQRALREEACAWVTGAK
ncbi:PilZ domain-containing protein [Qipengyuania sp. ASV99]|uniref:PilZ domain-containing protein n=1 Tax=Qipengyuania sp. ASV99 TaxID=3399681 RepID=UPI003A4C5C68